jgi:hypothetical protein
MRAFVMRIVGAGNGSANIFANIRKVGRYRGGVTEGEDALGL